MLRKRIVGPRRVVLCYRFKGTDTVVRDPALSDEMDPEAYAASLFDASLIKVKPGEQPTFWSIRSIPRLNLLAGDDMGGSLRKADWWIRSCLRGVENFTIVGDNGVESSLEFKLEAEGDYGDMVSRATMDAMRLNEHEHYALMGMLRVIVEAGAGPLAKPSEPPPGPSA